MSVRTNIVQYYEELATDYDHRFNNPRLDYMRSVENRVLLDCLKPGTILDVGCGTGEQTIFLARKGFQVIGMDISKEMIRIADERINEAKLNDNIFLIIASAEALPLKDSSVDGLISIFGVYSHVPDVNEAFREIHRVLKTDSKSIITVINRWNLTWWIKSLISGKVCWMWQALRNKEYTLKGLWTYYFSKSELTKMLSTIGFKVRIGSLLLLLYPHDNRKLSFYEKYFIRFEEMVRWRYPFNHLGYYHLVVSEKKN
jgi:ubiquinone/menaquinone biosynthesis C-methylase UbiE